MRGAILVAATACAIVAAAGLGDEARAQATRTWVSGVGDDANPCSRTAPCKTFAGAISKTAAQGEINCIDPGGFGAVTITKAIAIKCDGLEAGVLVSGTNGIVVNAGASDAVHLSGLDLEGVATGLAGISFLQGGSLRVDNVTIRGFTGPAISFTPSSGTPKLVVTNTIMASNTAGGVLIAPTAAAGASVSVDSSSATLGGYGFKIDASGTTGSVSMTLTNSVSSGNTAGAASALSVAGKGPVNYMIDRSILANSQQGAVTKGPNTVIVRVSNSEITGNTTGLDQSPGGQILSYKNNDLDGNTNLGTFGTANQQ